jgi:hypothetical protein
MKIRYKVLFFILLVMQCFVSCKKNPYKVRISFIKVDIEIKRLEKDLFTVNPEDISAKVPELKNKYDGFLQLFSYVINTGDINDPSFGDLLAGFCTDKQNNDVYSMTMKLYPDLATIEKSLEDAFKHYLYYFPGKTVPEVYSCVTGFNNSIITGDSALGIGLDRYLGADCEYYPRLEIYKYIAARMTPVYIVPDCMYGWGASEWDFASMNYPADNVMTEMIHEGKLRYFEKCMLPELPDEIIFGFTPGQMKFCRNNEGQMWQYLVENDLVFKTDHFIIRKLIGEAPFTSYFTNESPGRAAVWLGFRIVESYMARNKGTSLESLMKDVNIQGILEKSKYNPQ